MEKKFLVRMLTIAIMTAVSLSIQAENYNTNKCECLKLFYNTYRELFDKNVMWWQDSEKKAYIKNHCTHDFYSLIENEEKNGAGVDFLTCDYVDTMIMSTMNITVSDSCYIMTFKADWPMANGESVIKDVTLYIYTENGLISDVTESPK